MGQPKRSTADIVILKPSAAENAAVKAAIDAADTVGAKLAAARRVRGLSLQDVHVATKVKLAQLAAIEAGERSALPALPFTAGFIKAYAQFLGLDPDDYAKAYRVEIGAAPPATPVAASDPTAELHIDAAPAAPAQSLVPEVCATPPSPVLAVIDPTPVTTPVAPVLAQPSAPAPAPDRFPVYVGVAAVAILSAWMAFGAMQTNQPAAPVAAIEEPLSVVTAPVAAAPVAIETPIIEAAPPLAIEPAVEATPIEAPPALAAIKPPKIKPQPKIEAVIVAAPAPVIEIVAPPVVEPAIAAAPEPIIIAANLSRPAAPIYPERCARNAASDESVIVMFDVTVEGRPTNMSIAGSSNACFHDAALEAAGRMRFAPRTADGKPVMEFAKRATLRFAR